VTAWREGRADCLACGALVSPRRRLFCSDVCSRKRTHELDCAVCGRRFLGKHTGVKCCSVRCAQEKGRVATPRRLRRCATCGGDFVRHGKSARLSCYACRPAVAGGPRVKFHTYSADGPHVLTCEECGVTYRGKRRDRRFHNRACASRHRNRLMVHRRRAGGGDRGITIEALYQRDMGICGICHLAVPAIGVGQVARHLVASIDHVVPVSLGGPHVWSNVQLAHCGCNSRKGAKLFSAHTPLSQTAPEPHFHSRRLTTGVVTPP